MALYIWVAVSANWPEYGMIIPTLTGAWASAEAAASETARLKRPITIRFIGALPLGVGASSLSRPRRVALHGLVLDGPGEIVALLPGGVARPVGIVEVAARQHAQVRPAGGEDGVGVRVSGKVPHGHRRDARLVSDAVAERRLVEPAVDGLLVRHRLARGHRHGVAAVRPETGRDADRVVGGRAARRPVGGRDLDRDGLPGGPRRADRV